MPAQSKVKFKVKEKLASMKGRGEALLGEPKVNSTIFQTWSDTCVHYIQEAFGEFTDHTQHFVELDFDVNARRSIKGQLKNRIAVLGELISQLDGEPLSETHSDNREFWPLLHKRVVAVAKLRNLTCPFTLPNNNQTDFSILVFYTVCHFQR